MNDVERSEQHLDRIARSLEFFALVLSQTEGFRAASKQAWQGMKKADERGARKVEYQP